MTSSEQWPEWAVTTFGLASSWLTGKLVSGLSSELWERLRSSWKRVQFQPPAQQPSHLQPNSPLESRRCCWGCCSSKTSSRAPSCCCREICHDFALFPPLFCESPVPERRGALAGTDLRRRPMSAFNSTVLGNPWLQWSDQKVSDFQKHQQLTFYACEGGPRIC